MATENQIQANRNNAKKSTAPRTEQGKARASQNALKQGLLARDAVLPDEAPAARRHPNRFHRSGSASRRKTSATRKLRNKTSMTACWPSPRMEIKVFSEESIDRGG